MLAVLMSLRAVPETIRRREESSIATTLPEASRRRFRRLVVPMAPWVFAAPAMLLIASGLALLTAGVVRRAAQNQTA